MVTFTEGPRVAVGALSAVDDVALAAMRTKKPHHKKGAPDADDIAQAGPKPDIVEGVLAGGDKWLNRVAMASFIAPPVLSGIGSLANKVGGTWLGTQLKRPAAWVAKPFGETWIGERTLGVGQSVANVAARPIARVTGVVAPGFANRHTRLAAKHFGEAQALADKIDFAKVPEALHPHVRELQSAVRGASSAAHLDVALLEKPLAEIEKQPRRRFSWLRPKDAHLKLAGRLGTALEHNEATKSWGGVEHAIKNAPRALGKMDTAHVVANGAWVAASGVSIASDAHTFSKGLGTLKQMYADLTGQRVSTVGVLFGKVPAVIAQARSHLMKNYMIKSGTDLAGLGVMLKMLFNQRFGGGLKGMLAFSLPQMAAQGADMVMGESVLPAYQMLRDSFKKGQMPPDYYAAFIGTMSKDLKARGGAESPFAQAVAKQYAEMQATPTQILKEIESGALMKRVQAATTAYEAEHPHHPAKKQERAVVGKHTEHLSKETAAAAHKQGIGPAVS